MYLSYLDLKRMTFKTSPDPMFLWLSENHREALSVLNYGILKGDGFLLLTGDVGTGKTSLIRHILNLIKRKALVALFQLLTWKRSIFSIFFLKSLG